MKNNKNNTINKRKTNGTHTNNNHIVHIGLLTYMLGTALLGRVEEANRGGGTGGT